MTRAQAKKIYSDVKAMVYVFGGDVPPGVGDGLDDHLPLGRETVSLLAQLCDQRVTMGHVRVLIATDCNSKHYTQQ